MDNSSTIVRIADIKAAKTKTSVDDKGLFAVATFCATGLLVSMVLIICGFDLGLGFF